MRLLGAPELQVVENCLVKSVSGRVVLGGCVDSTLPSLHFNNVKSRELEL